MFETLLVVAALLCGLVAGLLFGFVVVAMPGIGTLRDGEFIRAFQVMDRIIQDNHPLFMVAWVGSVVTVIATAVFAFGSLDGTDLVLVIVAAVVYLGGVQVPTAAINIPLNNRLQRVDTATAGERELATERGAFEARWNRWNAIRTALAVASTALLIIVALRV